ncbi:MAG: hypothetical protein WAM64_04420, partial [Acidimicrobiales bacterium]
LHYCQVAYLLAAGGPIIVRHQRGAVGGSRDGSFTDVTLDDFRSMGDRFEVPGIGRTIIQVAEALDHWRDFAATAEVDQATTDKIASDLEELRPR